VNFPADCTTHHYVQNVIVPYVKDTRNELRLGTNQRALCIFDNFKAQCTDGILQLLEDNNITAYLFQQTAQGSSNQWT